MHERDHQQHFDPSSADPKSAAPARLLFTAPGSWKFMASPSPHVGTRLSSCVMRLTLGAFVCLLIAACSGGNHNSSSSVRAIESYCPYLPSKAFSGDVTTVSGNSYYLSRYLGNGSITNGTTTFRLNGEYAGATTYSLKIGPSSFSTAAQGSESATIATLVNQINASSVANQFVLAAAALDVYGNRAVKLTLMDATKWLPYSNATGLIQDGGNPNPIRFAEVRVSDSQGRLVQCAETQADGSFNFSLPRDGRTYTVAVASRASNAHNTAFVMNDPNSNSFYQITSAVQTSDVQASVRLIAPATATLEGGAFNILDQILNAQEYLRSKTGTCINFDPACQPFSSAPLIHVFWTPGLSPGVYYGMSGGISYYLNGKKELYLLGGLNGDTVFSDQDQFDNSVIIHEYGHFIEDQFGAPDSPGGSHDGDAIIDPRLAWGEGWADFFQAAVTGYPFYRDTVGTVDCDASNPASCTYVSFSEPLSSQKHDVPVTTGEGNYREFSIARELYSASLLNSSDPIGEVWATMHGAQSMHDVNDPFKSMGRFHSLQQTLTHPRDWTALRGSEKQWGNLTHYGQPVSTVASAAACASSPVTMTAVHSQYDDGSFSMSDQFNNNHFYRFDHGGGAFTLTLTYDKSSSVPPDLDLYIYRSGYVYGSATDIVAQSNNQNDRSPANAGQGIEQIHGNLPAGTYMINVMAFTGDVAATTQYQLSLNDQLLCPRLE